MSTFQQNQLSSLSPILISPPSQTITNHISLFDNSDQGSVDSDYTSLGSSKFYANSGSTSSLHHQGRSQSIDELASSTTTTTIPTRHFNGTLNINKSNNDPLQFVKIHPNHELIERAQEQLSLAESRKRLQENYKLINNSNGSKTNDEEVIWSKAVENWRQKLQQKRSKNVNPPTADYDRPISPEKIESIPKPEEPKRSISQPVVKSTHVVSSPPPPPVEHIKSKSPSPLRIKGPAKTHEIFIQKPANVRGFGFKLNDGRAQNRSIFISTIEEGSPADKAGLCTDDEVVSINDENIENMIFDQVRKILKERDLRGSIKMVVRTYEDLVDDNSQTVTGGFTTDHSRTSSPEKPISSTTVPPTSTTTNKPNMISPSTIIIQSPGTQFPSDTMKNIPIKQTPTSPLHNVGPKPFRSIHTDTRNNPEPNINYSSPIEAFRKMLNSSDINKSMTNESIYDKELQDLEAEFEKQLRGIDEMQKQETKTTNEKQHTNIPKSPPQVVVNTPQIVVDQTQPSVSPMKTLLHENSNTDNNTKQQSNDSPMAQVRSYVEQKMDQLQKDLEFGFSRTSKISSPPPSSSSTTPIITVTRDPSRSMNILVDVIKTPISPPIQQDVLRSSLKKSISTQNELDQIPSNRSYGITIKPHENVIHYPDPYSQQRPLTTYTKRSVPDLSSPTIMNRPSTEHSIQRTIKELRINMLEPYSSQPQILNQQEKKVTIRIGDKIPSQRITSKQLHATLNQAPRKAHFEDHAWINDDQRKYINGKTNSESFVLHHQDLQMNRQPMPNNRSRNRQQTNFDVSPNRQQHRTGSQTHTIIQNNNDRVLSVSGKLRCSKCRDELGQGSAMVIESLGLYYHIECFRCFVCNIPLSSSLEGIDVRVRNNRLHCQNCFSDENGVKLSAV